MKRWFSPANFSIAFSVGYVALLKANLTLIRYYPVPHQWAWGPTDAIRRPGPVIVWYGLLLGATLIGTLAALLLPGRWPEGQLRGWLWVAPAAALAACVLLLRAFFL